MGGIVSKITDDILGFDPNGGGIYEVANNLLGDTIADDILGLDPNGGGIVPLVNTGANIATSYLLGQAAGGLLGGADLGAAADADIAGGMLPEYGTNAAYDSAMASAMTPAAMAAIEAGIAGPMGPLTQAELGQGFQDYMQAAGYTADMMGPMTADQLGSSFQDYMTKSGYLPSVDPVFSLPKSVQDVLFKQLAGGLAANAVSQPTQTYTPPPAYKPQDTLPSYSPEYFNQVQNYYTGYMPNAPRDVATPLQDWYNTGYTGEDSVTKKLFGV